MRPLDVLVAEARADAAALMPAARRAEVEVARVLQICNACRYCEGFCAVFPAMTRRLAFDAADAHYLANLCHNCGACLYACQYAPPHDFRVNVPRALADVRGTTYARYAWPHALAGLYARNGLTVALALAAGLAAFLMMAAWRNGTLWGARAGANFYAIFPHELMTGLFAPVFAFAVVALAIGVARFWRRVDPGPASAAAVGEAASDALRLRYLDGGHGGGCNERDDRFTLTRRRFHHLAFYGFALCFASTSVATLYHFALGLEAPYGYTSLPKLLGIVGGAALAIGTVGLWVLNLRRDPDLGDPSQRPMDRGFIALLFLAAASGLVLTALRGTSALPLLLAIHLGVVMAFFVTMPYGKFAHGVYRCAALLKFNVEKRSPDALGLDD